jgi:hypothetical protein
MNDRNMERPNRNMGGMTGHERNARNKKGMAETRKK